MIIKNPLVFDLLTGHVHALVKERHRSREFIEFLKLLDAAYPADTAIELSLDNHSAHVWRETTKLPRSRSAFYLHVHANPRSWLNLIEGFFSKLARSVLCYIRQLQTRTQGTPDDLHC